MDRPSYSVQVRSRPMQPISTAMTSETSDGTYAAPWPTSSKTEMKNLVLYCGLRPLSFIILRAVSRQVTLPLSSMKRDLRKPLSVTGSRSR